MANSKLSDLRKAGTITHEFIALLEEHFPDRAPYRGDSHDDMVRKMGSVEVIRLIKEWKDLLDNPDAFTETVFEKEF